MAQGNLKLKNKAPARVTKKQINPKKASPRVYKPKKGDLTANLAKTHHSKLVVDTEKLVSSRVGHLELLKGSRRQLEKANKKK
ncbi:hypothetical protein PSN45_004332 [Yamadazyma tenuis]|uniref:Uncharacterized protein n=1 Tax=Candida tenuis (strain ATCC 10573 / BCRC 21748 / CBS 615 / JCM 9827 / NBRC 10315 / NRRL Y-1498 / VKM Y-70) TaxID=590646 RepID=G3B660_CANTC|nr:uncharacterized protein CANTEDRAFT_106929 [Yamadazyma tenuis ATCC 10573]EGV63390.1 hypothetical protein CANTEDRAFT_106929 [Yamadazyma tenuis ATCC 10573]WEJ96788.1 hypothetical protein PSN45_004332 [Yamadazyma tenuis]